MNAEIEITQQRFINLYREQLAYLRNKPKQFLEDLLHEAESDRHCETFSVRVASEINYAACLIILEERGRK
jgi:hypothetical protein